MPRQTRADASPAGALKGATGILLLATLVALGALAATAMASWKVLLQYQLQSVRCDLDSILFTREVVTGRNVGMEGRVRCIDRREFDFKRESANDKFRFRLCEPVLS
jgi:hypothetical protein